MGFYTFGRISQTEGYPSIYKIEEQQKLQEEIVGHPVTPIFYTHLPFIAPLAKILVNEEYVDSFTRWGIVLLFVNAINVYTLVHLLDLSKLTRENLVILCIGTFLFDPTFSGFINGQDTAILLLGAGIWAYGLFSKRYVLSGMGLSLTTVRPQIALFLAIPFLFHYRKIFWSFVGGSSLLALISIGLLGTEGIFRFVESIRYIESTVWLEAHALDMPTISGIIRRNLIISNYEPVQNLVWLFYLLGVIGFCYLWWNSPKIDERYMGVLALAAVFLVPYAHYHDLILLLIPIYCLIRIHQSLGIFHQDYLSLIPLTVSWLSVIGFAGTGIMKFPIVYAVMFLLGFLLLRADKIPRSILSSPA
ncbi:MAG TPA: glycosyltransferase family 87 protein [Anaerolineales bacterium]|nr:glycosyltransferase family 87 protein [Anaerolineales bacterium]